MPNAMEASIARRLQHERSRDAAYGEVRELRSMIPEGGVGSSVATEVGQCFDDDGNILDLFVMGWSTLSDAATFGPE